MYPFYKRSGDDGTTDLLGEGRVPKHHPRMEALGAIDEATAALGLARSVCKSPQTGPLLLAIQRHLYQVMAEVAATPENAALFQAIDEARVAWLEAHIDSLSESVSMPKEFILPGDMLASATLALARTAVRRAERRVAELSHNGEVSNPQLLRYLNRLSSLCFVLELLECQYEGQSPTLAKSGTDKHR